DQVREGPASVVSDPNAHLVVSSASAHSACRMKASFEIHWRPEAVNMPSACPGNGARESTLHFPGTHRLPPTPWRSQGAAELREHLAALRQSAESFSQPHVSHRPGDTPQDGERGLVTGACLVAAPSRCRQPRERDVRLPDLPRLADAIREI